MNIKSKHHTQACHDTGCETVIDTFPITSCLGPQINLFLHDVVTFHPGQKGAATAPGRDADPEKGLILARPQDLVCLTTDTHPAHIDQLSRLGFGPERDNIIYLNERTPSTRKLSHAGLLLEDQTLLQAICRRIAPGAELIINPFIVTAECIEFAAELGRRRGCEVRVDGGNIDIVSTCIQKHLVLAKARELGIPVPRGEVVVLEPDTDGDSPLNLQPLREAVDRQRAAGSAVIIKSGVEVLASKIFILPTGQDNIDLALHRLGPSLRSTTYLVEMFYNVTRSPNIVFSVNGAGGPIRCVGITDQRLSPELAPQGNIFPSRAGYLLSRWLQAEGFCGIVGYDFCEYTDPATGKPAFFLTEINPRINGSVYPLFVQARLEKTYGRPIEAFLSVKWFKAGTFSLAEFHERFRQMFFDPPKMAGMVPYNTSAIKQGIVDLVFLGRTREEVAELFTAATRCAVT